ncbi:hypothetical protein [Flavobacterium sp. ASV13]|uniref:hypothetical protein n=1 Tax=Flavobacterium sp. ASV13 TaxID=1506583 RepID=UPI000554A80F|nr:hypothetical protein [Flavobacterium sp. ASV13]
MKTVLIPENDLNVLRETLEVALKILQSYGVTGNLIIPSVAPKETKRDRELKYTKMIDSKIRGTKPNYLKIKNGKSTGINRS